MTSEIRDLISDGQHAARARSRFNCRCIAPFYRGIFILFFFAMENDGEGLQFLSRTESLKRSTVVAFRDFIKVSITANSIKLDSQSLSLLDYYSIFKKIKWFVHAL